MIVTWPDVMKFDLPENPVLLDIGGYKGDWVQIALNNYKNPTIHVFEPVESFYKIIVERWKGFDNVNVYNFGLSDENREETITLEGDSSTTFRNDEGIPSEKIYLRSISDFLLDEGIYNVDLAKINIEGEEYRLLEHLTKTPELNIIKNYLIQFHKFDYIDNPIDRRSKIVDSLGVNYDRVFNYEFVFEGWSQKKTKEYKCFGDSHVSSFVNKESLISEMKFHKTENFSSYRFGPYLAYNLIDKENVISEFRKINEDENVILCFGEIDCRAQVLKISEEKDIDYKEVIDDILERYFLSISEIKSKNIILTEVAPCYLDKPFRVFYIDNPDVFDCPRGTKKQRNKFKEEFNKKMAIMAEEKGYGILNIYNEISGNKDYYLDDIHLNPAKVNYLIKSSLLKLENG